MNSSAGSYMRKPCIIIRIKEGREMDFIQMLREDQDLADLLSDVCDVEILPEFQAPEDEFGHLTYNISGKTFARAASGSEYILLEDGSVGYWGSEGGGGRIADNLRDFFEFMICCPYWQDYLWEGAYEDRESLGEYAKEVLGEYVEQAKEDGFDVLKARQELADRMGIGKMADVVDILMRFHDCTRREPRFIQTYTENDGSTHRVTCLFQTGLN